VSGRDQLLAAAVGLAERGWRIVPLHTPTPRGCSCPQRDACKKSGKHPRMSGWPTRATSDKKRLVEWWREWPDANIGIVAGRGSGITVLDVDPRNGGDDRLAELEREHRQLPRTVTVETGGGGQHYYFAAPPSAARSAVLSEGLELLGERKLVVAPPSLHASGQRYEWDHDPAETPLAELPPWLIQLVPSAAQSRVAAPDVIPQGLRNTTLTSIAGRLRLTLPYPEGIRAALRAVNAERCRPPLPDAEVAQIARSAASWSSLPWLTSARQFIADERLSPAARAVLRAISDCANAKGEACGVSYDVITRLTGYRSSATIRKALAELEQADRLTYKRKFNESNVYTLSRALPAFGSQQSTDPLVLSLQNLKDDTERSAEAC
jgi:hypothetical protein